MTFLPKHNRRKRPRTGRARLPICFEAGESLISLACDRAAAKTIRGALTSSRLELSADHSVKRFGACLGDIECHGGDDYEVFLPMGCHDLLVHVLRDPSLRAEVPLSWEPPNWSYDSDTAIIRPDPRGVNWDLLDFVGRASGGLIELGPNISDDAVLIQLGHLLPGKRIVVLCDSREDIQDLQHHVSKNSMPSVREGIRSLDGTVDGDSSARMLFGTYYDSICLESELETVDMIVSVRAPEMATEHRQLALRHFWRAKRFGFIRRGGLTSQWERDATLAYFGFERHRISAYGRPHRRVILQKSRVKAGQRFAKTLPPMKLHQQYVVHHPARSAAIMKEARRHGSEGTLLIAADRTHANVLKAELPDWELLHSQGQGQEQRLLQMLEFCEKRQCQRFVRPNTIVAASDVGLARLSHYQTVINAAATTGADATLLENLDLGCRKGPSEVTLVVFDDRHHQQLRMDAKSRWDAYLDRGWAPAGQDPKSLAIERFLAERPTR